MYVMMIMIGLPVVSLPVIDCRRHRRSCRFRSNAGAVVVFNCYRRHRLVSRCCFLFAVVGQLPTLPSCRRRLIACRPIAVVGQFAVAVFLPLSANCRRPFRIAVVVADCFSAKDHSIRRETLPYGSAVSYIMVFWGNMKDKIEV